MDKSKIGLIGLGVMGTNLARNIANKGFKISVYNRTTEVMNEVIEKYGGENFVGFEDLKDMIASLERPRKVILLVKAGPAVDAVIEALKPLLDKDDIVIDCGNSNFNNTVRRFEDLRGDGIHFVGCGVSGGEEGALNGPSMMPGGTKEAWDQIKEIFEAIAARDFNDGPCVTYIGDNAAGHYVKMVHNGIEYGVMQIMAEAYDILKRAYNLEANKIAEIFKKFNEGMLQSYLFEIAGEVLERKEGDGYLVDFILDKAAQKGTGKWTAIDALDRGVGLPTITEAVYARINSSYKDLRVNLSEKYKKEDPQTEIELEQFIKVLEEALYVAMLISYAQGYHLIQTAAQENNWDINLSEISRIWEGGCIIRAKVLNELHKGFEKNPKGSHLFEIEELASQINKTIPALRKMTVFGSSKGIPVPALGSALAYFDTITSEVVPANFIQGLRDYFGAHTYKRTDKEGDFHTEWTNN
ncbi:NADP-dependent phosphogluconate dehydrogenase [Patescibacteria group bacterium]